MHLLLVLHLLFTCVLAILGTCPHVNPDQAIMECIKDMPNVDFGIVPPPPKPEPGSTTASPGVHHEDGTSNGSNGGHIHRRSVNTTDTNGGSHSMPHEPHKHSPPNITDRFMNFFCSDAGKTAINCTAVIFEECADHPELTVSHFNPDLAIEAQDMCEVHYEHYKEQIGCIDSAMRTTELHDCAYRASEKYMIQNEDPVPSEVALCRTTGGKYNCVVDVVGEKCGRDLAGFIVAAMRAMEDPVCTPAVDKIYVKPVSAASAIFGTTLTLLAGLIMTVVL